MKSVDVLTAIWWVSMAWSCVASSPGSRIGRKRQRGGWGEEKAATNESLVSTVLRFIRFIVYSSSLWPFFVFYCIVVIAVTSCTSEREVAFSLAGLPPCHVCRARLCNFTEAVQLFSKAVVWVQWGGNKPTSRALLGWLASVLFYDQS